MKHNALLLNDLCGIGIALQKIQNGRSYHRTASRTTAEKATAQVLPGIAVSLLYKVEWRQPTYNWCCIQSEIRVGILLRCRHPMYARHFAARPFRLLQSGVKLIPWHRPGRTRVI